MKRPELRVALLWGAIASVTFLGAVRSTSDWEARSAADLLTNAAIYFMVGAFLGHRYARNRAATPPSLDGAEGEGLDHGSASAATPPVSEGLPPHRGPSWQALWDELVPDSGAAATVQGNLLRATTRVASECSRNGGLNWDDMYAALARFARDTLTDGTFHPAIEERIRLTYDRTLAVGAAFVKAAAFEEADEEVPQEAREELEAERTALGDFPYDALQVMEQLAELWCREHREPIPQTASERIDW